VLATWKLKCKQAVVAISDNGRHILKAPSFKTLSGRKWLDSDVRLSEHAA